MKDTTVRDLMREAFGREKIYRSASDDYAERAFYAGYQSALEHSPEMKALISALNYIRTLCNSVSLHPEEKILLVRTKAAIAIEDHSKAMEGK